MHCVMRLSPSSTASWSAVIPENRRNLPRQVRALLSARICASSGTKASCEQKIEHETEHMSLCIASGKAEGVNSNGGSYIAQECIHPGEPVCDSDVQRKKPGERAGERGGVQIADKLCALDRHQRLH
eukprot:6955679-Prymnesium_polylepis.2